MAHQPVTHDSTRWRARRARAPLSALYALLILGAGLVGAAENRIELRDGSVITGELIGVTNGGYRVRSTALGEMTIPQSEVLAIRPASAGAAPSATAATPATAAPASSAGSGTNPQAADLAAIQQQLLSNPQTMEAVTRLQSDPDVQAALADPEFTRLIMSGNVEALRNNPRAQRLMENPAIKAIAGQAIGQ
ncbi:hypothetical protein [uncultured Thiodictyon sp.]|uniref:hypothetical protein n=1 Tax=uncultured Thiodictyon sp. TaxID=1846217 RepID=UPI0025CFF88A|nr:hypothetical protein [uncultured Thiodictyon sp.]